MCLGGLFLFFIVPVRYLVPDQHPGCLEWQGAWLGAARDLTHTGRMGSGRAVPAVGRPVEAAERP